MSKQLMLSLSLLPAVFFLSACSGPEKIPLPPRAKKINKELIKHEQKRIDPYYWLNERENPEVINYLEAENSYTDAIMKHTRSLQDKLYREITSRINPDDATVPYRKNGFLYYTRYVKGGEYPVYCRKKDNKSAAEEILLDVNKHASGHDYFQVRGVKVSPDSRLLAFAVDTVSRRKYTIIFKDLNSGEILSDHIDNTTGSTIWANDNRTVFYTKKDKALRAFKVFRHKLGMSSENDHLVYHEKDETFGISVKKSKSDVYIFIESESTLSTESRFLEAENPEGEFRIFQPRQKDHEYWIKHHGDRFFILTNYKAKNFRLMQTMVKKTSLANWREVIAHRDDVLLEEIEVFDRYLVADERHNGLSRLRVINRKDGEEHSIDFGEAAYAVYFDKNTEFDTDLLRYKYTSMTTPTSIYDYDMKTREKHLRKEDKISDDFNKGDYFSERVFATAKDGTKVPVSLVYRKSMKRETGNPLLLVGYGSYGSSYGARFRSTWLSLLDRGFITAIAHIRGGSEMGREWYENGKLFHKKNTFTDFIDCAEYLVNEGYTDAQRLCIQGGSAGGLLIGSVINMKPELFNAAIAAVPFVDVITTMLDPSIPLTTREYDEWGDPNKKDYYDYMLSYSPYDNVESKNYPALLVTTGLHDSQVQYWEPAKWVAKLRDQKTDNNILLLKTDMRSGHSGVSGRYSRHYLTAFSYAFLLDQSGIKE